MKTIKLILAGFGAMGKGSWFPLIRQMEERGIVELVACVDPVKEVFDPVIKEGKIESHLCFTDINSVISNIPADGIIIVTPPNTHEDICIKSARFGLHILCEKPLSSEMESAYRIVEAAKAARIYLTVGQNRRHTRFIHTMKNIIKSGRYGDPGQVYVNFKQIFTRDSFRDIMQYPLLLDMAIHHFDAIRYVLGKEPIGVQTLSWNPPWSRFAGDASAIVLFDYLKNLHVVYDASWHTINGDMTSNGCNWRIECERGVIICEKESVYTADRGDYVSGSYGGEKKEVEQVRMPNEYGMYLMEEFIHSIKEGKTPETSGEDNINTLKMVFGAIESTKKKERITLDFFERG
jgi:predicted dehydrogenase